MNVLLQIKLVNYLTVYDLKRFELAFKEKIGEEYLLLLLLLLLLLFLLLLLLLLLLWLGYFYFNCLSTLKRGSGIIIYFDKKGFFV